MKIQWILIIFIVLIITVVPIASAATTLKMFVNGQPVYLPEAKIINGLPYVSIHSISSELNLDVDYNEQKNTSRFCYGEFFSVK